MSASAQPIQISNFQGVMDTMRNPDLEQSLYDDGRAVMGDVLLTLHGDAHRQRRLIEFSVFQRGFFRHYEQNVFPQALEQSLAPYLVARKMDLVGFGYRVTINLTADFAGIDRPEKSVSETNSLLNLVKIFSAGATLVHSTRNHADVEDEVESAMLEFDERFLIPSKQRRLKLIEQVRRGSMSDSKLPRDVLTVLLTNQDRLPMSASVLRREMAFYLQAGSHSTANSTTHAMHEIFTWIAENEGERERLDTDPLFVQRCVHESLRLHPASPVAWRRAVVDTDLGAYGKLAAGESVVLDLMAANREKQVFGKDAGRFNPHRQLAQGVRPFGLTFGYGVHTCLGRDLDGGVLPRPGTDPNDHQYGIVTDLVRELLKHGVRPDPNEVPVRDFHTARQNWGCYPVIFM